MWRSRCVTSDFPIQWRWFSSGSHWERCVSPAPHLTKELLFAVILPGLLFEASFNIDVKEFWSSRLTIGALAVPGVVAAIVLTAPLVTGMMTGFALDPAFGWRYGLVFGALITATDAIAVVALFKQMHVGHRLSALVEGESLLNDGTSVVFFTLILAFVGGAATTLGALAAQFLLIVGGGIVGIHRGDRIDDVVELGIAHVACGSASRPARSTRRVESSRPPTSSTPRTPHDEVEAPRESRALVSE